MDEVGRELDDVVVVKAEPGEHLAEIREHLADLSFGVALADDLALAIDRELPGDVGHWGGRHDRRVRVEALRWAGVRRIDVANGIGHERVLSVGAGCLRASDLVQAALNRTSNPSGSLIAMIFRWRS